MGALANYIERAGVATASISLIREQSESVRPPRALWVPFDLGRPLGSAGTPDFQNGVIRAALGMLTTATEPTIEDYPVEAPAEATPESWVCPISFAAPTEQTLSERLLAEVQRLAPWAAETRTARGRTLFGVTGAGTDQAEAVAQALGIIAETGDLTGPPDVGINWAFDMPLLLRHLADDLRTFYHEALAAQPGPAAPNHDALTTWIFAETALGETLQAIAQHLTDDGNPLGLMVRGFMIPEGHFKGGSAFPTQAQFGADTKSAEDR